MAGNGWTGKMRCPMDPMMSNVFFSQYPTGWLYLLCFQGMDCADKHWGFIKYAVRVTLAYCPCAHTRVPTPSVNLSLQGHFMMLTKIIVANHALIFPQHHPIRYAPNCFHMHHLPTKIELGGHIIYRIAKKALTHFHSIPAVSATSVGAGGIHLANEGPRDFVHDLCAFYA